MLVAAFLAGSIFPFSSEAVFSALLLAGLSPMPLFVSATIGNVAGSLFNYGLGRCVNIEWIYSHLHTNPQRLQRAMQWTKQYGAWTGVLCFLPALGSAIAIALGIARANLWHTTIAVTIGKAARYAALLYALDVTLL